MRADRSQIDEDEDERDEGKHTPMARQQREEIAAARGCGRVGADNDCAKALCPFLAQRVKSAVIVPESAKETMTMVTAVPNVIRTARPQYDPS